VSLPRLLGAASFDPAGNIAAERLNEGGVALRNVSSFGLDPNGFRLLTDARAEAATSDNGLNGYTRGAFDATVSHSLGRMLGREFSAAVTAGAGSSTGDLPVQRLWYLGGTNTVRGQPAGAMAGDSYWLTHTEVGYGSPGLRRIAFFDLGWAGSRARWGDMGRPASGVGAGFSFVDGLIRADVARGLYPARNWRSALYLEARF
jgi:hemolysin activation/secretion protein